ncbi:MAG: endolytic transglycosylase MltG [Lachnospiraceae bacterium]|nr:endolytic transglycosylase MltG [Lachnospiraceae bacterium]
MKLKYYLRGLGIGIAVTAAVLMLAGGGKENLTDEEIIARAKELGMVESVTLSQLSSETESESVSEENLAETSGQDSIEDVSENISEDEGVSNSETDTSEVTSENNSEAVSDSSSEVASEEDNSQEETSEEVEEFVIIEVGSGDGSDTVSVKLEAAGLVEDAQMYDDFLCANGYDKILQTGAHEIPKTADWDMIAEILAGRM